MWSAVACVIISYKVIVFHDCDDIIQIDVLTHVEFNDWDCRY